MTAVAFDTLKSARASLGMAKMSPGQAHDLADARVDVIDGKIATKADLRDVQADIEAVKGAIASAKVEAVH